MRAARWLLIFLSMVCLGAAQEQTCIARYLTDFPGPQVCKDPTTGTLLYVESDGRHVAAISRDGKLLWNKDPFKDAHLPLFHLLLASVGRTVERHAPLILAASLGTSRRQEYLLLLFL